MSSKDVLVHYISLSHDYDLLKTHHKHKTIHQATAKVSTAHQSVSVDSKKLFIRPPHLQICAFPPPHPYVTLTLSFFASFEAGCTDTDTPAAGLGAGAGAVLIGATAAGAGLGNTPNCATFAHQAFPIPSAAAAPATSAAFTTASVAGRTVLSYKACRARVWSCVSFGSKNPPFFHVQYMHKNDSRGGNALSAIVGTWL